MNGKKIGGYLLLIVIIVVVIYFTSVAVSHRRTLKRYDLGYSQIKIGDSRPYVMSVMGKPDRIGRCEYTPFNDKGIEEQYRAKCAEQYTYEILLKDYMISFDKDGIVVGKNSAVSP